MSQSSVARARDKRTQNRKFSQKAELHSESFTKATK